MTVYPSLFPLCLLLYGFLPQAQQLGNNPVITPTRDPQAIAILQKSLNTISSSFVKDSVATGTIQITAGSDTDSGTIRISTLGTDQSSELVQTPKTNQNLVYSAGEAREVDGSDSKVLQLELAVTSQTPHFTWPMLLAAVNNADTAFQYLGVEDLNGSSAHHIRFWNTFASASDLKDLAELTIRDIWVDSTTLLPLKLAYEYREGRGASPRIPVTVSYSDYHNISGIQYPFVIEETFNGTPWKTITIQTVNFNTGLTGTDFKIR